MCTAIIERAQKINHLHFVSRRSTIVDTVAHIVEKTSEKCAIYTTYSISNRLCRRCMRSPCTIFSPFHTPMLSSVVHKYPLYIMQIYRVTNQCSTPIRGDYIICSSFPIEITVDPLNNVRCSTLYIIYPSSYIIL